MRHKENARVPLTGESVDLVVWAFALRTLGIVRDDDAMVEQAVHIFESMGLGWQVTETGRLIAEP